MMTINVVGQRDEYLERLSQSKNVCDVRKAHDARALVEQAAESWKGRCNVMEVTMDARRCMRLGIRLHDVTGLLLQDGQPVLHQDWKLTVLLPPFYPLDKPQVRFDEQNVPFNPHVLHRESQMDEATMPSEIHGFLEAFRKGQQGWCCYADGWPPLVTHDLRLLVWQVSRILGGRVFGERFSLNNAARDHYLRIASQGRLPLGEPLPLPHSIGNGDEFDLDFDRDDDAVEWVDS